MKIDIRTDVAKYYDYNTDFPNDISFYRKLIPSTKAAVLELGCGTGRVLIPLSHHCSFSYGIDISRAMISICRNKIKKANIPLVKARIKKGDITNFNLHMEFDLIIAPFRVLQNLETDEEVNGMFNCIHRHLAPGGTCILNVFKPNRDPNGLRNNWVCNEEFFDWEVPLKNGKLTCHNRRARMDIEKLILYPELIYRRYEVDTIKEVVVLKPTMRCYYPDTFEKLIRDHGFSINNRWGGYDGETYGFGPELIIQFKN